MVSVEIQNFAFGHKRRTFQSQTLVPPRAISTLHLCYNEALVVALRLVHVAMFESVRHPAPERKRI